MKQRNRPYLFIVLLTASVMALGFLAWLAPRLRTLQPILAPVFIGVTVGMLFILLGLAYSIAYHRPLRHFHRPAVLVIRLLYPLALMIGQILGKDKDEIRDSFIALHNNLTELQKLKVQPRQLLLLLPICLQWANCPYKVTHDIQNCRQCGKCQIGHVLALQRRYGFIVAVATGGTIARRLIGQLKPKLVLAVACERDLASGIQDSGGRVHVLGITNERPEGPCRNTQLDLEELENILQTTIIS